MDDDVALASSLSETAAGQSAIRTKDQVVEPDAFFDDEVSF